MASAPITGNVCPAPSYPGFRKAFDVGYELFILNHQVKQSNEVISELNRQANRIEQHIRFLSRKHSNQGDGNSLRRQLDYEYRQAKIEVAKIDRRIQKIRRRQAQDQSAAQDYADYIYDDYLVHLSNEFVDPRTSDNSKTNKIETEQSEFDKRIDELLNRPSY